MPLYTALLPLEPLSPPDMAWLEILKLGVLSPAPALSWLLLDGFFLRPMDAPVALLPFPPMTEGSTKDLELDTPTLRPSEIAPNALVLPNEPSWTLIQLGLSLPLLLAVLPAEEELWLY